MRFRRVIPAAPLKLAVRGHHRGDLGMRFRRVIPAAPLKLFFIGFSTFASVPCFRRVIPAAPLKPYSAALDQCIARRVSAG